MDETALARSPGDSEEQRAARASIVAKFREAGVVTEPELASANPPDLAARTGLSVDDIEWFQAAARDALRVELTDDEGTARVTVGGQERRLPIVPAAAAEDARAALERHAGVDVVLLQEGASSATLRVGASLVAGVPIVRGGTRVRVAAVRAPRDAAAEKQKESFWSRFTKKS